MEVNIKDVAEKAQVSTATVSRILNNKDRVAESTRERVLQVIEELGYQPNALARGLLHKQTQTIGVIFPKVSGLFSSTVLSGVEDAAEVHGFSTIVCTTDDRIERTMKYLQVLAERRVDGILFATGELLEAYHTFLQRSRIPLVLVATSSLRFPVPYVRCDDRQAAFSAVQHLIEQGHRDIALVCDRSDNPMGGIPRMEGYLQAMKAYGLPVREDNIYLVKGFGFQQGLEAGFQIAGCTDRPTAVFASSDEMAVGVMSAAYRSGLNVPRDLSVMGYDNLQFAEMSMPPLTTVSQPLYQMGRTAVDLLTREIAGEGRPGSVILPHQVVVRDSISKV